MLSHYSNSKFKVCDIGSYYLIETNCYSSEKVATVSYGGTVNQNTTNLYKKRYLNLLMNGIVIHVCLLINLK